MSSRIQRLQNMRVESALFTISPGPYPRPYWLGLLAPLAEWPNRPPAYDFAIFTASARPCSSSFDTRAAVDASL
jgi:hypothetical protein